MTVLVSTHYMDEAERCNELAYISYGRLLAQGSAAQLIAGVGLATCEIIGEGLPELAQQLNKNPAARSVASFGASLHVSASSPEDLRELLTPYASDTRHIKPIATSLEDVFIALMETSKDNF
jgi:ABC-2 type transport system ATP-binding protein